MESKVLEVIRKRRSIRAYRPNPIPDELLSIVLEAARLAPSARNDQPWHFIVVKDKSIREAMVEACRGQSFVAEAPVIIVGCADLRVARSHIGGFMDSYPVDLAIAFDHLMLVAAELGLGTCWIGAFNENKVKEILRLPKCVRPVGITPLGFPAESPQMPPRRSLDEVTSLNFYSNPLKLKTSDRR